MSREYARRSRGGSNLPLIIAIIGTIIVVAVVVYFFLGGGGKSNPALQPTAVATAVVETQSPTPGPEITPTPAPVIELPTEATPQPIVATPAPTPTPQKVYESATVSANALTVREGPGTNYSKIDKVRYGQTYKVYEETSKWIKIQLSSGSFGWIWESWTARGNETLPARPTSAPKPSFIKTATLSGSTIKVTFNKNVWGNSAKTAAIAATAFEVKEGSTVVAISAITACSGGTYVDLTIGSTSGGALTVNLKSNSVFDTEGKASPSGSISIGNGTDTKVPTVSFSNSGNVVTATFSETVYGTNSKSGDIPKSAFSVTSDNGTIDYTVVHSGKTVTITITYGGLSTGDIANTAITLYPSKAFDAAGNACTGGSKSFAYTAP
jgi:SH3-like domain-containing protein